MEKHRSSAQKVLEGGREPRADTRAVQADHHQHRRQALLPQAQQKPPHLGDSFSLHLSKIVKLTLPGPKW